MAPAHALQRMEALAGIQLTMGLLFRVAKKSAVQPPRSTADVEAPALKRCLMICIAKQHCYSRSGTHACP